jgi:hypothetical protein
LLHSTGCSFDPNILEICQEGCFNDFLVKFEDGSSPVKNKVTGAKNRKKLVNTLVAAVLIQISWKFVRKVVLMS